MLGEEDIESLAKKLGDVAKFRQDEFLGVILKSGRRGI